MSGNQASLFDGGEICWYCQMAKACFIKHRSNYGYATAEQAWDACAHQTFVIQLSKRTNYRRHETLEQKNCFKWTQSALGPSWLGHYFSPFEEKFTSTWNQCTSRDPLQSPQWFSWFSIVFNRFLIYLCSALCHIWLMTVRIASLLHANWLTMSKLTVSL